MVNNIYKGGGVISPPFTLLKDFKKTQQKRGKNENNTK
tara:strand:+ start:735 stop:848 length:114 start_codon:yes stop_codon:yes gene_type:complete